MKMPHEGAVKILEPIRKSMPEEEPAVPAESGGEG